MSCVDIQEMVWATPMHPVFKKETRNGFFTCICVYLWHPNETQLGKVCPMLALRSPPRCQNKWLSIFNLKHSAQYELSITKSFHPYISVIKMHTKQIQILGVALGRSITFSNYQLYIDPHSLVAPLLKSLCQLPFYWFHQCQKRSVEVMSAYLWQAWEGLTLPNNVWLRTFGPAKLHFQ